MKALRIFSFVAFLALGSAIAPQTASAFTYYVTLSDGTQYKFEASNVEEAINFFNHQKWTTNGMEAILSKRSNSGEIARQK